MDYLLEKRADGKNLIKIELSSSEVILGSDYLTALKSYSKVSKSHARLNFYNGSWYIEDLRSKYGVFLDYEKIGKNPKKIQNWSVIGLGGKTTNDNGFICMLCPVKKINLKRHNCDKDLSEKVRKKTHSKDKFPSKVNLHSNHSRKNGSKFSETNKCCVPLVRDSTEQILSKSKMHPEKKQLNKTSSHSNGSIFTNSSNSPERNWKIALYFRSMERNTKRNDNFYIEDEYLPEHLQDDDVQSTTSSVELMNKIMYPSKSIIFQIQKSKNNRQSPYESKENGCLYHTSSSVESLDITKDPSEYVLSEIQKSKQ